jgi:hypothetical protein
MPIEHLNTHTHDSGFLRFDWEYHTDASVDLGANKLNAVSHDGISAEELEEFIRSGADFDQITDREARQISAEIRKHFNQLTPEARKVAERFETKFQPLVDDLHDCSDERLAPHPHTWLGTAAIRDGLPPDTAILEGGALNDFMGSLHEKPRQDLTFVQTYQVDPSIFANVTNLVSMRG